MAAAPDDEHVIVMRDERGRFLPGTHVTGRPKGSPIVKQILKAATPEAARKLVSLLNSDNEKIVLQAAQEILNRAEGKPRESMAIDVSGGIDIRAQIRDLLVEKVNSRKSNEEDEEEEELEYTDVGYTVLGESDGGYSGIEYSRIESTDSD